MGSILNFIFLSDKLEKNGNHHFIQGPFFNYVTEEGTYSYTLNSEIKEGYKNVIFLEGNETLKSFYRDIEDDILEFVNNNDVKLLCVSLADPTTVTDFEEFLNRFQSMIDSKKLYVFDSNTDLGTPFAFDYFVEEALHNRKEYFCGGENELRYISEEIKESELDNFRHKKFISFNRNIGRVHRMRLLHEYLETDKFKDSYFSFLRNIDSFPGLENFEFKTPEYYNSFIPIELDTYDIKNKSSFRTSDTFRKDLFLDSCINLVTETSFDLNELFISEKILKPILNYQPFIVFGPYHYLKQLKTYGFKTFSDFWDESYDDIKDHEERLEFLMNLVNSLNSMSIEELNKLYKKTKDICIYNRNLFYGMKPIFSIDKFLNQIENEW